MIKKIKVIIADDNKGMCDLINKFLKEKQDVEILGIANTDEEEVRMIEELKPEIVITDLMRNYANTGLEIIKQYYINFRGPEFLVISAGDKNEIWQEKIKVAGFIKKPFNDYEIIYNELKRIKELIVNNKKHNDWLSKYNTDLLLDVRAYLNSKDIKILKKLKIEIKDKIYTGHEMECLKIEVGRYDLTTENELEGLDEIDKEYYKSLDNTRVKREEYEKLLVKVENLYKLIRILEKENKK